MNFKRSCLQHFNLIRNSFKNKSAYPEKKRETMEENFPEKEVNSIGFKNGEYECEICRTPAKIGDFHTMTQCRHNICYECLKIYFLNLLKDRIIGRFECPCCTETIHPNDVKEMLKFEQCQNPNYMEYEQEFYSYQDFLKKFNDSYLKATLNKIDGLIWCPGIDCQFAVIAKDISKCPKVKCKAPNCGVEFCANCRTVWHPSLKCSEHLKIINELDELKVPHDPDESFKICPGCKIMIGRVNDGKCNHMKCPFCHTNFCWLCLRKADQFHFISGGGCSMFGKHKPSKVKKIVVPVVTMIGAPVIVVLIALGATAYLIFYVPCTIVKKKNKDQMKKKGKKYPFWKSVFLCIGTGILTTMASIGLIIVGIPTALIYFYTMYPKSIISDIINRRKN